MVRFWSSTHSTRLGSVLGVENLYICALWISVCAFVRDIGMNMKITKTGNPDKIKKIKENREESRTPEIQCKHCDARFKIQASDVRTRQLGQHPMERTWHYVNCPCCDSEIGLVASEIPANYEKEYVRGPGRPVHPFPGFVGPPSFIAPTPVVVPDKTWIGDPIESLIKVICKTIETDDGEQ